MNSSALSTRTAQNSHIGLSDRPAVQPAPNDHESKKELNGANVPQPGRARKSRLKRVALMLSIVLATLGLAKVAYTWWTVGRFIESTDDADVGGDVTVIAPKVAGFISKLFVGDNQQVHAGDLLLKLDDRGTLRAGARADLLVLPAGMRLSSATRADIRLLVLGGRALYADTEYAEIMTPPTQWASVNVDGKPKMLESGLAAALSAAGTSEPGVSLSGHDTAGPDMAGPDRMESRMRAENRPDMLLSRGLASPERHS